jgi:hypothetical protein
MYINKITITNKATLIIRFIKGFYKILKFLYFIVQK